MSSVVFCQTGQCGNQLGYSLLEGLHGHLNVDDSQGLESFFRESKSGGGGLIARAVCIDTEPKVVNECLWRSRREGKWCFNTPNVLYRHGGAGNNWAVGYQMCSGDFLDSSINCLRRELEHCDDCPMILTVHSIAGGTGSGLGTHMTEAMADEFPDVTRMNIAITPYHFGEVVVQHYNSILSLAKISAASHAVLTFENEVAQELCKKMRRIERPSLDDINQTITSNILPIMLPKFSARKGSSCRVASHLQDDVVRLCSHPAFKFIDVKTTPQTSEKSVEFTFDSWTTLLSALEKMHDRGTAVESRLGPVPGLGTKVVRSVGCLVTMRGIDAKEHALTSSSASSITNDSNPLSVTKKKSTPFFKRATTTTTITTKTTQKFFSQRNFSVLADDSVHMFHSSHAVNGYQRSATLLSNGQAVLPILQRAASKGADLFRAGAYLHQYTNCGLEEEDFISSFRNVGRIIESYSSL